MTKQIDFSTFSSIKIGPVVDVEVIDTIAAYPDVTLLGGANNLLIAPNPPKLAMLGKNFDFIHEDESHLYIGGATMSGKILSYAKRHDIAHFELMQKLPGTLGGMVKMNAGLKEWEIFNHLIAMRTEHGWIQKKDITYGYRKTHFEGIVFEAKFEKIKGFDTSLLAMFRQFRDNQPHLPSAGSCFKNPDHRYAGKLLDDVGLKGATVGNMAFSQSHANFLVNLGGGTYEEAITLIEEAKRRVFEKYGIDLELEIKILGHKI
ncbi:UDP-N-acetylmuramate dehydrogenase [Sulfurospirillum sp. 1612]|uniref:UDP-N-acetylmuramate dehydrogenase n=1 Tax=Sulfurospirillum sp. 1612 TaxID=3094835 RepID=UPI002F937017